LGQYVRAYRGYRLRDPEGYERLIDREAKRFADQSAMDRTS
jgi:hypothetical protein